MPEAVREYDARRSLPVSAAAAAAAHPRTGVCMISFIRACRSAALSDLSRETSSSAFCLSFGWNAGPPAGGGAPASLVPAVRCDRLVPCDRPVPAVCCDRLVPAVRCDRLPTLSPISLRPRDSAPSSSVEDPYSLPSSVPLASLRSLPEELYAPELPRLS